MNYNISYKNYTVMLRYNDGSIVQDTKTVFDILLHAYKVEQSPTKLFEVTEALNFLHDRETQRRKGKVFGRGNRPKLFDKEYLYWADQQGKYVRRLITNDKRISYEHPDGVFIASLISSTSISYGRHININMRSINKGDLQRVHDLFNLNISIRKKRNHYEMCVRKRTDVMSIILATYNHVDDNQRNTYDNYVGFLKDYDYTFAEYFGY